MLAVRCEEFQRFVLGSYGCCDKARLAVREFEADLCGLVWCNKEEFVLACEATRKGRRRSKAKGAGRMEDDAIQIDKEDSQVALARLFKSVTLAND